MRKAIFITGKSVQDHEFIYPFYRLKEAGFEVQVATEDGKETVAYMGIKVLVDKTFDVLKIKDYNLLIIPGGAKAMEYVRQNQKVLRFISDFHKAGKVIASICHGSQLLISAGIVRGKKISGYYSIKDDINNAGATYVDAPVVVDSKIVTSPHYKYLGDWMRETLKFF